MPSGEDACTSRRRSCRGRAGTITSTRVTTRRWWMYCDGAAGLLRSRCSVLGLRFGLRRGEHSQLAVVAGGLQPAGLASHRFGGPPRISTFAHRPAPLPAWPRIACRTPARRSGLEIRAPYGAVSGCAHRVGPIRPAVPQGKGAMTRRRRAVCRRARRGARSPLGGLAGVWHGRGGRRDGHCHARLHRRVRGNDGARQRAVVAMS